MNGRGKKPLRLPLVAVAVAMIALGALGVVWHRSRHAAWETPQWAPERFVAIRVPQGSRRAARRVVAVNPRCSQCAASLERAAGERRHGGRRTRLVALIVDTPRRPSADVVTPGLVDEVWWDAAGVWRRRWGHRIYGETLLFDAAGRHRGSLAPGVGPGRSPP